MLSDYNFYYDLVVKINQNINLYSLAWVAPVAPGWVRYFWLSNVTVYLQLSLVKFIMFSWCSDFTNQEEFQISGGQTEYSLRLVPWKPPDVLGTRFSGVGVQMCGISISRSS